MAADVATSLKNWSTDESHNSPAGSTAISTNLDDNIRMLQAVTRAAIAASTTIASATTTDIGTKDEGFITVTGTTTITGLGTVSAGIAKWLIFSGALTFTHNATSLILPSAASITTAAGDCALMLSLGSGNWRCLSFLRADGSSLTVSGSMTNGSAASPALNFVNSPTTGFYRQAADSLGVATAGTLRFTLNSTAAKYTVPLLLPAGSSTSPALAYSGGNGTTDQGLYFGTNSMTLQSNGVDATYTLLPSTTIAHKFSSALVGGTALNVYQVASSGIDETVLIQFNASAGTGFNAIRIEADASSTPDDIWRVRGDGATFADGAYSGSGADYAEAFLYTGQQPMPGDPVALDGDRVRIANDGDDIIGVVSDKACAIGDAKLLDQGGIAVGIIGKLRVNPGRPVRPEWRRLSDSTYLVK